MANWTNMNINTNQVETQTARAVLINMPHNSHYDGYNFWHPLSLVDEGRHSAALSIRFSDEWEFKLTKTSKGRSHEVLGTAVLSAAEMMEEFGHTDQNITAPKAKDDERIIEVVEPEYMQPESVEVPECLTTN